MNAIVAKQHHNSSSKFVPLQTNVACLARIKACRKRSPVHITNDGSDEIM